MNYDETCASFTQHGPNVK